MSENEEQAVESTKPESKKQAKEKKPKREKVKKPKNEKAEKPKKTKDKNPEKVKKPLSPGKAALITAVVFLLLIGGVAGALIMDVGGTRKSVATMLQGGAEAVQSQKELELMAKEKEQAKKEEELASREKTVSSQETALDKREKELDARQELLEKAEQESADSAQSLKQLADVYAKMEPESAAQILSQLKNKQDITDILKQMQQNKVAGILAAMTPQLASEITLLMKQTAPVTATAAPTAAATPVKTG